MFHSDVLSNVRRQENSQHSCSITTNTSRVFMHEVFHSGPRAHSPFAAFTAPGSSCLRLQREETVETAF